MLESTYYPDGKNEFSDDTMYTFWDWTAPIMISPEEIRERMKRMCLEGRRIKRLRLTSHCFRSSSDYYEDNAYLQLENYEVKERQRLSAYFNIPPDIQFERFASVDNPLQIQFEDGDCFEIRSLQEPAFQFSMNCIPWWVEERKDQPNIDANVLFSPCVGRRITSVEIQTYFTNNEPFFDDEFEDGGEQEVVSYIILWLENDVGLRIGCWVDFCFIDCIDQHERILKMSMQELRPALYNREDLHIDRTVGFESHTGYLFFGPKTAKYLKKPYITLVPGEGKTAMYVSVDHFLLFDWSIGDREKRLFDMHGAYHYPYEEWMRILDEMRRLLRFENLEELMRYRLGLGIQDRRGNRCKEGGYHSLPRGHRQNAS